MNQINVVTIGKLIEAHRDGDEQKFKTYVDFIVKPTKSRRTTVPHESFEAAIRVTTVSRGKLFWMKQSNRLCIMRQVGTNPKS